MDQITIEKNTKTHKKIALGLEDDSDDEWLHEIMPFDDFELDFELEKLNICRTIKLILDWRLDCLWCLFTLILWLIVYSWIFPVSVDEIIYYLKRIERCLLTIIKLFVNNYKVVVQLTIK